MLRYLLIGLTFGAFIYLIVTGFVGCNSDNIEPDPEPVFLEGIYLSWTSIPQYGTIKPNLHIILKIDQLPGKYNFSFALWDNSGVDFLPHGPILEESFLLDQQTKDISIKGEIWTFEGLYDTAVDQYPGIVSIDTIDRETYFFKLTDPDHEIIKYFK